MEQLIIKDLELFAYHGVNPEEKSMGQKFVVDATITIDLFQAGNSDHIDDALNYAQLCHDLQDVFTGTKHDLIERAATVLCEYILLEYPGVSQVDLTLKKPWAPIHLPLAYPAVRILRSWHQAFIAVGSSLGDKKATISKALEDINASSHTSITKISSLIETDPVGYTDQDTFINGAFEVQTMLSPAQLMKYLLEVEKSYGRERTIKWGPRTLDLDIIYYDDLVTSNPQIILPHPLMHERSFVLEPLAEIAPYALHPLLRKRTLELLEDLKS